MRRVAQARAQPTGRYTTIAWHALLHAAKLRLSVPKPFHRNHNVGQNAITLRLECDMGTSTGDDPPTAGAPEPVSDNEGDDHHNHDEPTSFGSQQLAGHSHLT